MFFNETHTCPGSHAGGRCEKTCDSEELECYVVDNNGFVMVSGSTTTMLVPPHIFLIHKRKSDKLQLTDVVLWENMEVVLLIFKSFFRENDTSYHYQF